MSYPKTKTVVNGTEFNIASKYRIIKAIGTGAYGIVASAEDTETGAKVAIKKVPNAFHDLIDAKRILREIKLLKFFGEHENLTTLVDLEEPASAAGYEDIYIITNLMETDLHRITYSKQKLTDQHVQYFIYQILRGLKYLHSANVIHRDLKPSNILLNSNCDLRICDLGLARGILEDGAELTEYVVTRWYRAPEIMLGCRAYSKAIDLWSVGCILAELLRRKPLFPGADYLDMLKMITMTIGSPTDADLHFVKSEKARAYMGKMAGKPKQPWSSMIKKANPMALDLLDKLLTWDPEKRLTVDEALAHPYMAELHCPDDEPAMPARFDFTWEKRLQARLEKPIIQRAMYDEAVEFRAKKTVVRHSPKRQMQGFQASGPKHEQAPAAQVKSVPEHSVGPNPNDATVVSAAGPKVEQKPASGGALAAVSSAIPSFLGFAFGGKQAQQQQQVAAGSGNPNAVAAPGADKSMNSQHSNSSGQIAVAGAAGMPPRILPGIGPTGTQSCTHVADKQGAMCAACAKHAAVVHHHSLPPTNPNYDALRDGVPIPAYVNPMRAS